MKQIVYAFALVITLTYSAWAQGPKITAIKAGTLIDVVSGKALSNQVILITDDKITAVGGDVTIPQGAEVIDLSAYTVLPGLIDCHTHITAQPESYYPDLVRRSAIDMAITAHIYAERTLLAGFTTCRDMGASEYIDVALKHAIDAGKIPGPRLYVAGLALSATGGHGDVNGLSPYIEFKGFSGVADGPDEIRKLVRQNVKYGADVIKMLATAGVLSEEESVGAPQYSQEEMNTAVNEAHLWGKRVAAHAHGALGIKMAVTAGVSSVEHCSLVDADGIQLMKQKGTYLVPTVYALDYIVKEGTKNGLPDKIVNKAKSLYDQRKVCFHNAVVAGVKIAYGTDAGVFPHGLNGKDFALMVDAGMTPMQTIQAATVNAADLIDITAKAGSIAVGKYADIIAVKTNPLTDVKALETVNFVMKGGVVYKR